MFAIIRRILALTALGLLPLGLSAQSKLLDGPPKSAGASSPRSVITNTLGIAYPQYLWPKASDGVATVYYTIDAASDPAATPKINAAIKIFNADFSGVIQWVPWSSSLSPYYVDINLSASNFSGECEANEGYEGVAAQPMTGSTNCTVGTILHEMGHVIGLWHEQARADRNTYVTVNYGNVIKDSWGNFAVLTDDAQSLGSYDYASVMQYIPFAFTRNGGVVIESIPAGIPMAGYEGVPSVLTCPPNQTCPPYPPAMPVFDYSAGDKEAILRLYGAPPTKVTVTSNPVGLTIIVDGVSVTTPQTYSWPLYSTHTLDVQANAQRLSGYILNSSPPAAANFYYTFGRWSDSTEQSHGITVTPGNGSAVFPKTAPAVATYSANFIQLVPYRAAVYPANDGTVAVSPQPQIYPGLTGQYFFVARQQATLTASPVTGWNFYEFNNSPYWLPGGLGANPKSFYVPDSGNPVNTTAKFSDIESPIYTVAVTPQTFSSGTYAYVDSSFVYTPKNFSAFYDSGWTAGSTNHTLSFPSPEYPYSYNSRFNFASWSDGGAATHAIPSLPSNPTSYIATVTPEFQPATNFGFPPCGGAGTITPGSSDGFYATGTTLTFMATPDASWLFAGWSYDLTGTTNPMSLTADDETLVFANFNTTDVPLTLTSTKPSSALAGGKGFTMTLNGTGFTRSTLVYINGTQRTATHNSSIKLTVPVEASDIADSEGFQVAVENFPTGWQGCAVFGYQTFLVTGAGPPTATPKFSPKGGTYSSPQSVTISDAVSGAAIYYTTDGSTPTTSSPVYSGAIPVNGTETLKAMALATGYIKSALAKAVYTIN